jgi:hypothetical protein
VSHFRHDLRKPASQQGLVRLFSGAPRHTIVPQRPFGDAGCLARRGLRTRQVGKTDRSRQNKLGGLAPFNAVRHFGRFENVLPFDLARAGRCRGPLLVRQVFLAGKSLSLWSRRWQNERQGYFWTYR